MRQGQLRRPTMAITKEEAVYAGPRRMVIHDESVRPCAGKTGPFKWYTNGKCRVWVRDPERFELPVKHDLYAYGHITHRNLQTPDAFHLEQYCKAPDQQVTGDYRNHASGCGLPYEHPGGCLPYEVELA